VLVRAEALPPCRLVIDAINSGRITLPERLQRASVLALQCELASVVLTH